MAHFAHHERSLVEKPVGIALIAMISAVVGATVAMLFTPKRGSELRSAIADKTRRARGKMGSKASDVAEDVKDKVAESATLAKDATKTLADKAKEKTDAANEKVNNAADTAKQKSDEAEARIRNRANR